MICYAAMETQRMWLDVNGTTIPFSVDCPPNLSATAEYADGEVKVGLWDTDEITSCRRLMRGNPEEREEARKSLKPEMVAQIEREIRAERDSQRKKLIVTVGGDTREFEDGCKGEIDGEFLRIVNADGKPLFAFKLTEVHGPIPPS